MKQPRILAFGGSLRVESYNQKLAAIASVGAVAENAEVELIALRDYPLPLFDEDLEAAEGLPENAKKLKALFSSADGLLIASPEYNSSITAALKNVIDWVSRSESADEPPLSALAGKSALILSASPGGYGGLRGLVHLRSILGNIGILVLPDQTAIPHAYDSFNEEGELKDAAKNEAVKALGGKLATHLTKLLF